MTFARVWLTGLSNGQPAGGSQLTQLDINVSRSMDGAAGGKSIPTAKLIVGGQAGLQVGDTNEPTPFATPNAKWAGGMTSFGTPSFTASASSSIDVAESWQVQGRIYLVSSAGNDSLFLSADAGGTWGAFTTGHSIAYKCATSAPDAIIGGSVIFAGAGTSFCYLLEQSVTNGTGTFPGTPSVLNAAHYDSFNKQFIFAGNTSSAPYLATMTIANPPVATSRTVPAAITGVVAGLSIAQNPVTGRMVASWASQTKVAYSDDGITWTASTTTLSTGSYIVRFTDGAFLAMDMVNTGIVYTSTDGVTWTTSGVIRPSAQTITVPRSFASFNGAFIATMGAAGSLYISFDRGATWKLHSLIGHNAGADYTTMNLVKGVNRQLMLFGDQVSSFAVYKSLRFGFEDGSA